MKQLLYFTLFITMALAVDAQVGERLILSLSTADSIALDFSENEFLIEKINKKETEDITPVLFGIDGDYGIMFYPNLFDSLVEFIKNNFTYPDSSKKANIKGIVYISFIINEFGSMSDIKIIRGLNAEIDVEMLRVFSIMPKLSWWRNYKPHDMQKMKFILPIKFA
jgi:hypothetical protein